MCGGVRGVSDWSLEGACVAGISKVRQGLLSGWAGRRGPRFTDISDIAFSSSNQVRTRAEGKIMIPRLESDTPYRYSSRGMHACSESHTIEVIIERYSKLPENNHLRRSNWYSMIGWNITYKEPALR